jgi:hypothetical protein
MEISTAEDEDFHRRERRGRREDKSGEQRKNGLDGQILDYVLLLFSVSALSASSAVVRLNPCVSLLCLRALSVLCGGS